MGIRDLERDAELLLSLRASVGSVRRRVGRAPRPGGRRTAHIEFDIARQFDDGFRMTADFEQSVFDGLRAVDEQAAIETVLFLGDPLSAPVPADKDDG